jgi:hypothetical protein
MMGDQCGINTMFNTGTVIGVSANIFGILQFLYPVFLGVELWIYTTLKAFETRLVMGRRNVDFDEKRLLF